LRRAGGRLTTVLDLGSSDLENKKAVFTGKTILPLQSGNVEVNTRLTITLSGSIASWEEASVLCDYDPSFDTSIGVVAKVGGDFSATLLFEAYDNGSWQPAIDLFNTQHTQPGKQTAISFETGFAYTVEE